MKSSYLLVPICDLKFFKIMESPDCNYIKIAMGKLIFWVPDSPPLFGDLGGVDDL